MVLQLHIVGVGEVLHAERLLCLCHTARREGRGFRLFVNNVIRVDIVSDELLVVLLGHNELFEPLYKSVRVAVKIVRRAAHTGNDKRCTRLVDQNRVDLVDDGVVVPALNHLLLVGDHIVAQVVKAELVVGAVGNIGGIRLFALLLVKVVDNQPDLKPEKAVYLAHPLRVALC